jgi:hypothetical protein
MPIASGSARESPDYTFDGEPGLHMIVFSDIHTIIIIDELVISYSPIGHKSYYNQK